MKWFLATLIFFLSSCKSQQDKDTARLWKEWANFKPSTNRFDLHGFLESNGWDVYLITNGLIYVGGDGPFGVEIWNTNGELVGWMNNGNFLGQFSNKIDWVRMIQRGKPYRLRHPNSNFVDTIEHPDGFKDSITILKAK